MKFSKILVAKNRCATFGFLSLSIMKKLFPIIALVALFSWGCDEADISDISAPVSIELVVNSSDSAGYQVDTLDGKTSADFMNNRSKIKTLTVDRIQYRITTISPTSGDTVRHGAFEFMTPNSTQFDTLAALHNQKLPPVGLWVDLDTRAPALQKLITAINTDPYEGVIRFGAVMDHGPTQFTVGIKVFLKLKI